MSSLWVKFVNLEELDNSISLDLIFLIWYDLLRLSLIIEAKELKKKNYEGCFRDQTLPFCSDMNDITFFRVLITSFQVDVF